MSPSFVITALAFLVQKYNNQPTQRLQQITLALTRPSLERLYPKLLSVIPNESDRVDQGARRRS
jgi:hypothetical protein